MMRSARLLAVLAAVSVAALCGAIASPLAGSPAHAAATAAKPKAKKKAKTVKPTRCTGKGAKRKCTRPGYVCKKVRKSKRSKTKVWRCTKRKSAKAAPKPGGPAKPTVADYSGTGTVIAVEEDSLRVQITSGSPAVQALLVPGSYVDLQIREQVLYSVDGATVNVGTEDVCVGDNVTFSFGSRGPSKLSDLDAVVPVSVTVTAGAQDCFDPESENYVGP